MTDQAEAAAREIARATPRQMAEQVVAGFSLGNGSLTILAFREKQLAVIEAAIAAAIRSAEPQWQPIESAPKDGTRILICFIHQNAKYARDPVGEGWIAVHEAQWIDHNGGGWTWHGLSGVATAWRPLPAPPEAISGKEPGA